MTRKRIPLEPERQFHAHGTNYHCPLLKQQIYTFLQYPLDVCQCKGHLHDDSLRSNRCICKCCYVGMVYARQ